MDFTVSSGVLRVAGAVDMSHVSGSAVEVVVVHFQAVQAGRVRLSVSIASLGQADLAGTPIGSD